VNDIEDPHTTILQERRGRVAIVTLNRPERLNALNAEMRFVLLEMLHDLDHDDDVHVVVLTGAGRGFCSGADRARLEIVDRAIVQQRYDTETIRADFMLTMKKPVIAAVNGPVAGIGVAYAAMADIRIAAAGATWIAPFAQLGLVAELGLAWLLPRLVGTGAALDILLAAEPFTSETAYRIGLVQRVVPVEEVLGTALALAEVIATRSLYSVISIKDQVRRDQQRSWDESFLETRELVMESLDGPDFKAAMDRQRAQKSSRPA
jgi:enoyl-CoA hydratase/carnithine racemase